METHEVFAITPLEPIRQDRNTPPTRRRKCRVVFRRTVRIVKYMQEIIETGGVDAEVKDFLTAVIECGISEFEAQLRLRPETSFPTICAGMTECLKISQELQRSRGIRIERSARKLLLPIKSGAIILD